MPKIGKNIYRRKDGRWEGRYIKARNEGGKIIYGSVYGKTCTEVKQRLSSFIYTESASSVPTIIMPSRHSVTFAEVTSQWLSVISLKVKPSTYAGYMASLELHILPAIGNFRIHSLSSVDISRFAKEKLEKGRVDGKGGLSSKTVRDLLSIIKVIMDFACNENIISGCFAITYPTQQQQNMRVLSRQEQSSLEAILNADLDVYKLGILLCLYTGLRIGELCALRWQDISADFDMLSVEQTIQRIKNLNGEETKTRLHIDTPKSRRSVGVLRAMWQQAQQSHRQVC